MSIFYAYHVVTEHKMHIGQHIIFDENHHNGVYERVMNKLPIVNDIYDNPNNYHNQELEYPVMVALRELALEDISLPRVSLPIVERLGYVYHNPISQQSDNSIYLLYVLNPTAS